VVRIWISNVNDIKTKAQHFDMEAYYRNESKRFDLVCSLSERKQTLLIWYIKNCVASKSFSFWPKNSGTKQSNLIWSGNCLRQSRTFLFNPKTNRIEAKYIDLVRLLSERKQNVLIWSAYYRNESKTFWFGPLIIGTKAKQLQFDLLRKLSLQKRHPASLSRRVALQKSIEIIQAT
jgi:hypothetical protein